ncbi:trifunctional transcriptional regulator/proline dehydrogenase/L-glutamate gamma-semialdehyde dehydrogenase [Piscinibacter koreensis]|uniref:Bifunctional protein PutA n=1 Tax=Piscinibacter koreensis TaxID=2742824 RepID=A0A7Y6TWB7_9BURK|nr:trifunctional transcriptional regulator/proline dehydrogenase/L-glutamate gamma-semialdehyde dehydrogenase [Schlegelella koreensis]NUZ05852.1 trifunctional transcriptional regulator/proline dehydrogenase/L-glutamate gamma-semialdehyde dehydrogenase [Schlegelella koreensis]
MSVVDPHQACAIAAAGAANPPFTLWHERTPSRQAIAALADASEPACVAALLDAARLTAAEATATRALAMRLVQGLRERADDGGPPGLVQGLLQEFALSSHEGVALMCLAEALLRIPDAATRDALIRDKVGSGDWLAHVGRSDSLFVNAASWGLLLTGKLVSTHSTSGFGAALGRIAGIGGEPLIRRGVDLAMRMLGEQFVTGETIESALAQARTREARGFRFSYDMLGEGAMTAVDAERYAAAYAHAIDAIGRAAGGRGVDASPGLSIKLSALHPRYSRAQVERVHAELYPRLLALVERARRLDIGINLDAEEADRLELSLDLLERLVAEPSLAGWAGLGFVVQAYQKRAPAVIDHLVDLARASSRRLMVRLVKGAYWDSEIKRAQVDGVAEYPVYTRRAHTDVAYLACARRLLDAGAAVYPQFATHNAQTLASVHTLASARGATAYEFQCLHGMGEPLYEQVVAGVARGGLGVPCRIYAPVGRHDTLLAYLVRRLLENGANTSFVNRVGNREVGIDELIADPVRTVEGAGAAEGAVGRPHPAIPLPRDLYGTDRRNARGVDLASEPALASIATAIEASSHERRVAGTDADADRDGATGPAVDATPRRAPQPGDWQPIRNPADPSDVVGHVRDATPEEIEQALTRAVAIAPDWAATAPAERAAALERAADAIERDLEPLAALVLREAGRTLAAAVAEVREAVDSLRHHAGQVRRDLDHATHRPLGPVACISPWNFPLAIFVGQVGAALAAGNPVLAKPAEQTPLVAAQAVHRLHAAGVPHGALQLLPGPGETVGAALAADTRIEAVLFTGSTAVAKGLQRTLAQRLGAGGGPVPLIAETGGQNALVVDSSALAEQVVADALTSAFDSAGQRCSALRILAVQRDVAERVLTMLEGALGELRVGDPRRLATDVGPVIDAAAAAAIEAHVEAMRARGCRVVRAALPADLPAGASFVAPTLIEFDRLDALTHEVFGPVLHVLRYRRDELPALLAAIAATGYALTGGVHTRIDERVAEVAAGLPAGNLYVNRNLIGAVVGVQPFGGHALSGTGPKAGGPLYLLRLLAERPLDAARASVEAAGAALAEPPTHGLPLPSVDRGARAALQALARWAGAHGHARVAAACDRFAAASPAGLARTLRGPTGEANLYAIAPRHAVACIATDADDQLIEFAAVLAVGSRAVWPAAQRALATTLPAPVRERIAPVDDPAGDARVDVVLAHGDGAALRAVLETAAARDGAIVPVLGLAPGDDRIALEGLCVERSISINTAAAGGNASLMTVG